MKLLLVTITAMLVLACSNNSVLSQNIKAKNNDKIYKLVEMSHSDISSLNKDSTVVILQGGILEEHGPHLSCWSDGYISMKATEDVAKSIVDSTGMNVLVFPIIPLGTAGFNGASGKNIYPGTYAVTFSVLRSIFMNMATELGEQGFSKVMVIHIHGTAEHNLAIDQACEYFDDTYDGFMVNLFSLTGVGWYQDDHFKTHEEKKEDPGAMHADMFETSLNLYLVPELVQNRHLDLPPLYYENWSDVERQIKLPDWQGYVGSPRLATQETGEKIMAAWSSALSDMALRVIGGEDYSKIKLFSEGREPGEYGKGLDAKHKEWLKSKDYLYSE